MTLAGDQLIDSHNDSDVLEQIDITANKGDRSPIQLEQTEAAAAALVGPHTVAITGVRRHPAVRHDHSSVPGRRAGYLPTATCRR